MKSTRLPHRVGLHVSDHALLRFLERAGGIDVESLRRAVAASIARAAHAAEQIGGGDYRIISGGVTYVVRDQVVVTILHDPAPVAGADRRVAP